MTLNFTFSTIIKVQMVTKCLDGIQMYDLPAFHGHENGYMKFDTEDK